MKIRLANHDDRATLIELYLEMLQGLDKFNFELLPTEHNAAHFVDNVFLPAAGREEPVLIAEEKTTGGNGEVVWQTAGALFWVGVADVGLQFRYRSAHGYGTYVRPAWRKAKLGTTLRKYGVEILRELGYTHVLGGEQIANKAGVKASRSFGFVEFAVCDRLDIGKIPALHP